MGDTAVERGLDGGVVLVRWTSVGERKKGGESGI
jgi:hypothetical protein